MTVSINGDSTYPQPTTLQEELVQIQSENKSIAGNLQRNRIGQKKQATLTHDMLAPADYQNAIAKFTTGSGVSYVNDQSNYTGGVFSFSGLPYFTEDVYVPGSSLYRKLVVKITEQ